MFIPHQGIQLCIQNTIDIFCLSGTPVYYFQFRDECHLPQAFNIGFHIIIFHKLSK